MKFHRASVKAVRLLENMRKLKGFMLGSVPKALIFPKLLIHPRLPCLIPFLERLIGSGAWEVVLGVLN
jgi:hypothetical protein